LENTISKVLGFCGGLWEGEERRGEELLAVDVGVSVQFFSLFDANCEAHLAS